MDLMNCKAPAETATTQVAGGGSTALSGFLYQMLVAFGLSGLGSMQREEDHISALLLLARGASVVHEGYDGDVALLHKIPRAAKNGVVLVQCKFSKSGTSSEIAPKELKGILDRLYAAAKKARGDGRAVTGFFLVTNRTHSQGSDKILRDAKAGKSGELNRIQNCIARQLIVEPPSEPEFWESKLTKFASEFGLLYAEYNEGRQRLLGSLLERTGLSVDCEVSRDMLVQCLTGSRTACPITHAAIQPRLEWELKRLGPAPRHQLIARHNAESAMAMHSNRALIVCVGQGGTGKSAALREWGQRESQNRFIAARRPANVTDDWISAQIQQWRGSIGTKDSAEDALARIGAANPNMQSPLLLLCLDGIDERVTVGSHTQYLSAILEWFWAHDEQIRLNPTSSPKARLIVTCRRFKDFEQFWFPNTSGAPEAGPELPPIIEFEDFNDDEFAEILRVSRGKLSCDVYNHLVPQRSALLTTADTSLMAPDGGGDHHAVSDSPDTILRHPAMWEAFIGLSQTAMLAVLNGETWAEEQLAESYIQRFFQKAGVRSLVLEQQTVELAFIKIAVTTKPFASKAKHSRSLWYSTLGNDLCLGVPIAEKLLAEAMSSGLVIGDYDAWVWRFAFVHRYLAGKEKT